MKNKTTFRRLLFSLVVALLPGLAFALSVKITTASGEPVFIPVESVPNVWITEGNVEVVQNDNATIVIPLSDCPRFEFADNVAVQDIDHRNASIRYANHQVILEGFKPGVRATVHSLNGMLVAVGTTDGEGNLSLDMTNVSAGTYIVSTPIINTKLVIK